MRTVGVAGPHPGRSDSPSLRPGAHENRDVVCSSPGYSQVFPILASFELQRVLRVTYRAVSEEIFASGRFFLRITGVLRRYQRIPTRAADGTTFPATNYGSEIRVVVSP